MAAAVSGLPTALNTENAKDHGGPRSGVNESYQRPRPLTDFVRRDRWYPIDFARGRLLLPLYYS
jgi:hypothetical protein